MNEGPPSLQHTAAREEGQIHDDKQGQDLRPTEGHEVDRGASSAAGCQDIVDNDDPMPRTDGVLMEFLRRGPVLKFILAGVDESGKFALLSHRDEPRAEMVRQRGTVGKSPRLNADHRVNSRAVDLSS